MTKRALCIGINDYPGTDSDLGGCLNDARDWRDILQKEYDFVLVSSLWDRAATKVGIIVAMKKLLWSESRRGDLAVITYSGHGTWVPDKNKDEADGRDECLCPWDIGTSGAVITDDELYELFRGTPRGVKIVMISDSCHSGTVTRFCPPIPGASRRVRYLAPDHFLDDRARKKATKFEATAPRGYSRNQCLLLAGCKDTEYSYDATFGPKKRPNGAFTRVALDVLKTEGPTIYQQWYDLMRERLPSQSHPQTPQIQGTPTMRKWRIFA